MKFELKRPQIFAEHKTYGQYLMDNPAVIPKPDVPMETEGFIIIGTNYGTAEDTSLPFKIGDWVDADYINSNFNTVNS